MFNKEVLKDIEMNMASLKAKGYNKNVLTSLKNNLNRFFTDSKCKEVYYTENMSKPFFGAAVYIKLSSKQTMKILMEDDQIRLSEYSIEIDSKLFTEKMLTAKEATACLLHEVGHTVNDSYPVNIVRQAIDTYMVETRQTIKYVDSDAYWKFLAYGIEDSIRRLTSIFCIDKYEILADEFVVACGYGDALESAFKKISNGGNIGPTDDSFKGKLTVMEWTLRTYSEMGYMRSSAIRTLNKMKSLTGCRTDIEKMNDAIAALQDVNPSLQIRECTLSSTGEVTIKDGFVLEEAGNKGLVSNIQKKGLRGIEEDVYEYQMRIKNVSDELEAIHLMRQINTRMSMLDDWMEANPKDPNIDRYQKCWNKYDLLRDELSTKDIGTSKNYQLWFDYDALDNKK